MLENIKSSKDKSILFNKGRRLGTPDLTLIVLRNEKLHDRRGRVAFIAGKKLGNAVWRNRAKRRMRAICADLGGPIPHYDVLFIARKSINESPYEEIRSNVKKALERIDC